MSASVNKRAGSDFAEYSNLPDPKYARTLPSEASSSADQNHSADQDQRVTNAFADFSFEDIPAALPLPNGMGHPIRKQPQNNDANLISFVEGLGKRVYAPPAEISAAVAQHAADCQKLKDLLTRISSEPDVRKKAQQIRHWLQTGEHRKILGRIESEADLECPCTAMWDLTATILERNLPLSLPPEISDIAPYVDDTDLSNIVSILIRDKDLETFETIYSTQGRRIEYGNLLLHPISTSDPQYLSDLISTLEKYGNKRKLSKTFENLIADQVLLADKFCPANRTTELLLSYVPNLSGLAIGLAATHAARTNRWDLVRKLLELSNAKQIGELEQAIETRNFQPFISNTNREDCWVEFASGPNLRQLVEQRAEEAQQEGRYLQALLPQNFYSRSDFRDSKQ